MRALSPAPLRARVVPWARERACRAASARVLDPAAQDDHRPRGNHAHSWPGGARRSPVTYERRTSLAHRRERAQQPQPSVELRRGGGLPRSSAGPARRDAGSGPDEFRPLREQCHRPARCVPGAAVRAPQLPPPWRRTWLPYAVSTASRRARRLDPERPLGAR